MLHGPDKRTQWEYGKIVANPITDTAKNEKIFAVVPDVIGDKYLFHIHPLIPIPWVNGEEKVFAFVGAGQSLVSGKHFVNAPDT